MSSLKPGDGRRNNGRKPFSELHRVLAFWSKVDVRAQDECWPWLAATNSDGYGGCSWGGKTVGAHRVAYMLYNPDTAATAVLHTCDNPPCCNPAHLVAGNQSANMRDMADKGRQWCQRKTHCVNGHPFDEVNTRIGKRPGDRTVRLCRACAAIKFARWKAMRALRPEKEGVA